MPILGRDAPRLLTVVNNKPHASPDDHFDLVFSKPAMSRPLQEVEIDADPISSDDEGAQPPRSPKAKTFIPARHVDTKRDPLRAATFKHPQSIESLGSVGSKRNLDEEPQSSDKDGMLFNSQALKRRKQSKSTNIHAAAQYGKQSRARQQQRAQASFKRPRHPKTASVNPTGAPEIMQFVRPKGHDLVCSGSTEGEPQLWPAASTRDGSMEDRGSSSPLSSLSSLPLSPGVEEIQALGLPPPKPYTSTFDCPICGQTVIRFLRQEFEDQFTPGKQLSYRWQQRFCIYHKQQEGKAAWLERGYPEIDWGGLEKRMIKRHGRLLAVIGGTRQSYYRDQLQERLKERINTTMQALNAKDAKRAAVVGYYGPRGEKMMTDHIVAHLSDPLRKQSTKDRIVAAAGVSGGVSGFVQAVLVPELAQQLVIEDMGVDEDRCRQVIAESAELGDLLHPETEEKVAEVIDLVR